MDLFSIPIYVSQAQNSGYKIDKLVHVQTAKHWNWSAGMPADMQMSQHDPTVHVQGFSCWKREADDHDII